MELQNLSSNWKRLQATLDTKKPEPEPPQRQSTNGQPSLRRKKSARQTQLRPRPDSNDRQDERARHKTKTQTTSLGSIIMPQSNDKSLALTAPSASLALWAEDNDIPAADLAEAYGTSIKSTHLPGTGADQINAGLSKTAEVGKYIAIDCEMVGVGGEEDRSVLARVSVVNFHGQQVYDSYVRPREYVTDWRTRVSGISPKHMAAARDFVVVQSAIADLLQDRIILGHAIRNDLSALLLKHPQRDIRDTARHRAFRAVAGGQTPALKKLAKELLGIDIQGGEHSSIEDARACMLLFRRNKDAFEAEHANRFPARQADKPKASKDQKSRKRKKRKN